MHLFPPMQLFFQTEKMGKTFHFSTDASIKAGGSFPQTVSAH